MQSGNGKDDKKNSLGAASDKKAHSKDHPNTRTRYTDQSTYFLEWVNTLGLERTYFGRFVKWLEEKLHVKRIALLVIFSILLAFLINLEVDFVSSDYQEGDIVVADIKSPISFDMVDFIATGKKRQEAEESIPLVFDYDTRIYDSVTDRVYRAFRLMRAELAKTPWPRDEVRQLEKIKSFLIKRSDFEKILEREGISEGLFEWLVENRFSVKIEQSFINILDFLATQKISQDFAILKDSKSKIVLRVLERSGGGDEFTADSSEILDMSQLRKLIQGRRELGLHRMDEEDKNRTLRLLEIIAVPNVTLNKQETALRRQTAREAVLPVMISVKKNQVIVRQGSTIQPTHILILEEIRRLQSNQRRDLISLTFAFLFVAALIVFISYTRRFTLNKIKVTYTDFVAMGTVMVAMVLLMKTLLFVFAGAFEDRFGDLVPSTAYLYLVPAAAGPMMVGLLIAYGEVVLIFTLLYSTALSFLVEDKFSFLIVTVITGVAAARGVYNCKKRNDIYWAGLRTAGVNSLMIAFVTLIFTNHQENVWHQVLWNVPAGFIGGIVSSLVALMLIPLLETIFNYTTDVKLLELSNLNHPLLREMIVKAPGTYHHSLVVGSMVEAAAEEIGANPLLAKVSSYYHDIGKTEHAGYFIENQRTGSNPHDHLSPHMSKTILVAHVKDGVELGEKFKLGKPIIDVIRQHHGTTLISFFYHKAKQSEDEMNAINEEDFRYPGPKPQHKEAALSMLADSIEAAARSLDEPNPVRLQNIVKNIIHNKFMDGQLDECDLTLKDLLIIEESFTRILLGIYHQRIDYPQVKKTKSVTA